TYALIAANVLMFAVEVARGIDPVSPTPMQLRDLGASYPPLTLGGDWWRLGASMFLHFGLIHIALNMVCLYQARVVEALCGHLGFAVVYLVAGLGGGVASLIASPGNVTAGASGAVFGVYGAFAAFLVLRRSQIPEEVWQRTARSLASFLVINLVFGLTASGISLSSHVGGFIVGFAGGATLLAGARADAQRTGRSLAILVAGLGLTALAVLTLRAPPLMPPALDRFDAVEHASITAYNAAVERAKTGEIKDPELADFVEREVLAPYRKARADVLATRDIPEGMRPLVDKLETYAAARIAAWEALEAALREGDPEKHQAKLEVYKAREAEVATALAAYNAEVEHPKR
ncbi:MAG TPA: rhomboid family intramembrane serine protease, partial [Kofleriaceae bacterium]|nr:rhomboid family intramembrane serine protease [Kofleriaceae bacterium]